MENVTPIEHVVLRVFTLQKGRSPCTIIRSSKVPVFKFNPFPTLYSMTDLRISAVQAVTCSHPNIAERAASGNASGRCVLWAPMLQD